MTEDMELSRNANNNFLVSEPAHNDHVPSTGNQVIHMSSSRDLADNLELAARHELLTCCQVRGMKRCTPNAGSLPRLAPGRDLKSPGTL